MPMRENLESLRNSDEELYASITNEEQRQKDGIELIPSENYAFPEVLAALGSVFTNKYWRVTLVADITEVRKTLTT